MAHRPPTSATSTGASTEPTASPAIVRPSATPKIRGDQIAAHCALQERPGRDVEQGVPAADDRQQQSGHHGRRRHRRERQREREHERGHQDHRAEPAADEHHREGAEQHTAGAVRHVEEADPGLAGIEHIDSEHHEHHVQRPDHRELGAEQADQQSRGGISEHLAEPVGPALRLTVRVVGVRRVSAGARAAGGPARWPPRAARRRRRTPRPRLRRSGPVRPLRPRPAR